MIPQNAIESIEIIERQPDFSRGIDFDKSLLAGFVDTLDAVAQAAYKILSTERFEHAIYSWGYGIELSDLIGTQPDYAIPQIEKRIREALLMDDRIVGVSEFIFIRKKETIAVSFVINTIYGDVESSKEVNI